MDTYTVWEFIRALRAEATVRNEAGDVVGEVRYRPHEGGRRKWFAMIDMDA